jgi:hypothetical protein
MLWILVKKNTNDVSWRNGGGAIANVPSVATTVQLISSWISRGSPSTMKPTYLFSCSGLGIQDRWIIKSVPFSTNVVLYYKGVSSNSIVSMVGYLGLCFNENLDITLRSDW